MFGSKTKLPFPKIAASASWDPWPLSVKTSSFAAAAARMFVQPPSCSPFKVLKVRTSLMLCISIKNVVRLFAKCDGIFFCQ
jgi:hypothetical protein